MAPLAIEDYVVRSTPGANPAKRRLGHTAWFFETFVLSREGVPGRDGTGYSPLRPEYQEVFGVSAGGSRRLRRLRGRKARIVLGALAGQADALRRDFPDLRVLPVAVDFSRDLAFPPFDFEHGRIAIFYAGSSLGNFEPEEAAEFLARVGRATGPGSRLLLGVDRKKDKGVLDRAYNDPEGLNAAFNRNILNNVNALADGDFNPEKWIHRAFYDERHGRIELWLLSAVDQTVRVAGETLRFAAGDRIHTENSYKYEVEEVLALAAFAWRPLHHWSDPGERFSVFLFGR